MASTAAQRRRLGLDGQRDGFTIIEIAMVMIVVGLLASIAIPSFNRMQRDRAAQNARDAFAWMAAKARTRAIEQGVTQLLEVDPVTERAWIVRRNLGTPLATDTLQTIDFTTEHKATISTAANTLISVCYNPRGYAFRCAAGSPTANVDVTFTTVGKTARATIKVLGQIERI